MPRIKVTFSDGSTEIFNEEQTFTSIVKTQDQEGISSSLSENYSLWNHHHDKLTPSFIDLLVNSIYFFDVENPNTIYSSNSIVKFENL